MLFRFEILPPTRSLALGQAALGAMRGSVEKAARALGLSNRFALYRLMKKLGMRSDASE